MRIVITTSTFPRWDGDIQSPFVYELARHLTKRGHYVYLIAPHSQAAKSFEVLDNIHVYRFRYFFPASLQKLCYGAGMLPNIKASFLAKIQVLPFVIFQFLTLAYLSVKYKPDIINAHWIVPQGLVAVMSRLLFKNIPIVVTAHGSDLLSFNKGFGRKVVKFAIEKSQGVTVNSSATYNVALDITRKSNVVKIPMGVSINSLSKGDKGLVKAQYGCNGPVLLFIGRLIELKGAEYLINAIPAIRDKYPETNLLIIGDGPEKLKLFDLVKKLKLQNIVHFVGKVKNDALKDYFAGSDVLICPSVDMPDGGTEGLGMVILESMASGTPVIASHAGGIIDIVKDRKTGLLVAQRSSDEISDAVCEILINNNLKTTLVNNALNQVKTSYTWDEVTKEFERYFIRILDNESKSIE